MFDYTVVSGADKAACIADIAEAIAAFVFPRQGMLWSAAPYAAMFDSVAI